MKKASKQVRSCLVTLAISGGALNSAMADGYRNPPPTAEGIAKAGVNQVFVDDASAISYNPANLTESESGSIVASATFAKTENSYNNLFAPNADSQNSWALLPNFYASMPVGENGVVAGLGITTPYGQGADWNPVQIYNPYAPVSIYSAEVLTLNFNPTVAFKLGDNVSVGVGADIYYSEMSFNAIVGTIPAPAFPGPGGAPTGSAHAEGDDVAFGGNIGVTWQMTERQKATFTYRSEVELDYGGELRTTPGSAIIPSDFGLTIKYPNLFGLGYGIELTDTIRLEANLEWIEWSKSKAQQANLGYNGPLVVPQNWDDTITMGVGGDWQFAENWVFRTGYAYIESPVPNSTISPTLPDADRHVLSFGLGYTHGAHALDVAYAFSFYDKRNSLTSAYPGSYDIDSDLAGLTYSFTF